MADIDPRARLLRLRMLRDYLEERLMVLTPEEFAGMIRVLIARGGDDSEAVHADTDEAMENLLIALGYGEAVGLIRDEIRWYA